MDIFDINDGETISLADLERVRHGESYQLLRESVDHLDDESIIDLLLAGLENNEKEGN